MYAVIFTYQFNPGMPNEEYKHHSKTLNQLVKGQKGFIKVKDFSNEGELVSISYWETLEDIAKWSADNGHIIAKQFGKEQGYAYYTVEISHIVKSY
jgi:hypothetical protein